MYPLPQSHSTGNSHTNSSVDYITATKRFGAHSHWCIADIRDNSFGSMLWNCQVAAVNSVGSPPSTVLACSYDLQALDSSSWHCNMGAYLDTCKQAWQLETPRIFDTARQSAIKVCKGCRTCCKMNAVWRSKMAVGWSLGQNRWMHLYWSYRTNYELLVHSTHMLQTGMRCCLIYPLCNPDLINELINISLISVT